MAIKLVVISCDIMLYSKYVPPKCSCMFQYVPSIYIPKFPYFRIYFLHISLSFPNEKRGNFDYAQEPKVEKAAAVIDPEAEVPDMVHWAIRIWGSHGKTMGKPWENHGKTIGKWWMGVNGIYPLLIYHSYGQLPFSKRKLII